MSDNDKTRDEAIAEWEAQKPGSLLKSKNGKSILVPIIGILVLCFTLFLIYSSKHKDVKSAKVEEFEPAASRQAERVHYEPPPPAPDDEREEDDRDEEELRRQQAEAKRLAELERMRQARQKSALSVGGFQPAEKKAGSTGGAQTLGGDSNSAFFGASIGKSVSVSRPSLITNLEYKVLQGKWIEVEVDPRVTSDLPGQICASVQSDVYGAQGREKLIPWGSHVCGIYRAELRRGQDRVFTVWNRLVRPDGVAINMDSPGTDQLGTAGMGGIVDTHWAEIFGNAALISIIGAGVSTAGVGNNPYNSSAAYRDEVRQSAAETADSILGQYVNMPPTVIVPHGTRAKIYINRDLDFSPLFVGENSGTVSDGSYFPF